MDYIEIKRAVIGVAIAALVIARIVRLANGGKFDSLFRFTKSDWAIVIAITLADVIHGAIEDIAVRIAAAAFASIVGFGFIGKYIQSRKSVTPPVPNPDAASDPNRPPAR